MQHLQDSFTFRIGREARQVQHQHTLCHRCDGALVLLRQEAVLCLVYSVQYCERLDASFKERLRTTITREALLVACAILVLLFGLAL